MNFKWEAFLTRHRTGIVHEWQQRLKQDVSLSYAQRPVEELAMTVGKGCDAFGRVMTDNDYTLINEFIHEITQYADHLEKEVAERTGELRESEHMYKTLVEDISDGYLVLDKEQVAFVNPAFCRMPLST